MGLLHTGHVPGAQDRVGVLSCSSHATKPRAAERMVSAECSGAYTVASGVHHEQALSRREGVTSRAYREYAHHFALTRGVDLRLVLL